MDLRAVRLANDHGRHVQQMLIVRAQSGAKATQMYDEVLWSRRLDRHVDVIALVKFLLANEHTCSNMIFFSALSRLSLGRSIQFSC